MEYSYEAEHLALAAEFAAKFHGGQVDKTGDPYLLHVHRVSAEAYRRHGMFHAIVGMLHDVVEDTVATFSDIDAVFGRDVVFAVTALTRDDDETYVDYVDRVTTHPDATRVKLIDLEDNLNRNARLRYTDEETARSLTRRYLKALDVLENADLARRDH